MLKETVGGLGLSPALTSLRDVSLGPIIEVPRKDQKTPVQSLIVKLSCSELLLSPILRVLRPVCCCPDRLSKALLCLGQSRAKHIAHPLSQRIPIQIFRTQRKRFRSILPAQAGSRVEGSWERTGHGITSSQQVAGN